MREEKISKQFLVDALESSELDCLFATGTAAAITFIKDIEVEGKLYHINSHENSAIIAIKKQLEEIKLGLLKEDFGWNFVR